MVAQDSNPHPNNMLGHLLVDCLALYLAYIYKLALFGAKRQEV